MISQSASENTKYPQNNNDVCKSTKFAEGKNHRRSMIILSSYSIMRLVHSP